MSESGSNTRAKASRLRRPAQFKRTFAKGSRARSMPFMAVFAASEEGPRLGLAISKRHAPRAVERNRVKRQIREDFRQRAAALPKLDCVIVLQAPTRGMQNIRLRQTLEKLWKCVEQKCDTSSSC